MSEDGHTRRLRVLFLTKGLGPGGMERLLVHQARVGDRERFEYHAAYLVERPNSLVPDLEAQGVECVHLTAGSAGDARWLANLRRIVRDRRIDVVHAHSPQPAAFARPVLRSTRQRPRLVYTEHNSWDCYGPATRFANAVTYPLDDAQFAVSTAARDSIPVPMRRRVEVLTHGIDLDGLRSSVRDGADVRRALGLEADQVLIANVAHLRTEKAQEVLLKAAAPLLAERPEAVVLVLGHGPRLAELEGLCSDLGLGERFRFLGFRQDAHDIVAASDIFCLSSRQEGLPLAFMEASALGVPTVSTRVGGIPDHLADGQSGLLTSVDDPDGLSAALLRMVENRELRDRLGAAARKHSAVFDARRAVERQEQVYAGLCGLTRSAINSGSD